VSSRATRGTLATAAAIDVALVILFTTIGRRSHDEGVSATGVASTAAPFLIALAVGWIVARQWRTPRSINGAIVVWIVTVALGALLRRTLFDRSTATSFVIVATIVLGLFLVGWRAVAALRRTTPARRTGV
jgi:hypothetical protein